MMSKNYKGRAIIPGDCRGSALVTKTGLNLFAAFLKSLMDGDGSCVCGDIGNPDLYGKSLQDEIICIPQAIGSTSSGFMLQSIAAAKIGPKAILFARPGESLALAGLFVADIWENTQIITVDSLGDDFLDAVKDGDEICIHADGRVEVLTS